MAEFNPFGQLLNAQIAGNQYRQGEKRNAMAQEQFNINKQLQQRQMGQMDQADAMKRIDLVGKVAPGFLQLPPDKQAMVFPGLAKELNSLMPGTVPDGTQYGPEVLQHMQTAIQIHDSMQKGTIGDYGGLTSAVDSQGNPVFIQPSKTGGVRQVEGYVPTPKPQSLGATYQLSEEESNSVSKAIAEGRLDPYKVNSRTAKQYAANEMRFPGTNWNQIGANAAVERNPMLTRQKINLAAVVKPIEELKTMAQKLGGTQYPAMNKLIVLAKKGIGDTDVVAFEATRNNVMQELANAMRGQGISEGSIQLEMSNWDTAYSTEQLGAAADQTLKVIKAKQEALNNSPYQNTGPQSKNKDNDPLGLR
jgi:hypothetical protein